ncbi:methyltransferase [candidate division KSB1 bacterium]|nr:methyltransferase [candidate division KSB1 bacterium]
MSQTPREIVNRCLKFDYPERVPRDLWTLPWAENRYPEVVTWIRENYPSDFTRPQPVYKPSPRVKGDPYTMGFYTDEWGCTFRNIQEGVIGEVETPQLEDIGDWPRVHPPYEQLPDDEQSAVDRINRFSAETDLFVMADCCPRPWERYQFIRGTINAMMDVMAPEEGGADLLRLIHEFYLTELEFWVKSDVDGIFFMDDWGTQNQLLIPPRVWRELFKPLYRDYCDLAHAHGKFAFMHSDGHISEIYPDLIEVGVDGINSQLFCMDMAQLAQTAKGRITFWGEIDRQHVLVSNNLQQGRDAVKTVIDHLYDPSGGVIAQFEFGPGAAPEIAKLIFPEWERLTA